MTNPTPTPHVTIYAAIGQRIRTQREAAGLSPAQLAAAWLR